MMAQLPMTTLDLASVNREAWQALPQVYRDDDCLEFYQFFDVFFCMPKPEELPILGQWECFYSKHEKVWKDTTSGRPIHD